MNWKLLVGVLAVIGALGWAVNHAANRSQSPTLTAKPGNDLSPFLVDGEAVHLSFKGMRDSVVFTNKRLITVNVQGLTGKKRDYSSLP